MAPAAASRINNVSFGFFIGAQRRLYRAGSSEYAVAAHESGAVASERLDSEALLPAPATRAGALPDRPIGAAVGPGGSALRPDRQARAATRRDTQRCRFGHRPCSPMPRPGTGTEQRSTD